MLIRLAAVLLFAGAVSAQSQQPQQAPVPSSNASPQRERAQDQDGPASQVTVYNAQPSAESAAPSPKTYKEYGQKFVENAITDPIVGLTAVLLVLALVQFVIYRAEVRDTRTVERAYMSITQDRPGLLIDPISYGNGEKFFQDISIKIKVKNNGNTPAIVTFHLFHLVWRDREPLPRVPRYDMNYGKELRLSLVKDENYTIAANFSVEDSMIENLTQNADDNRLYLIGYVDYMDKFGGHHRCGYARKYEPSIDQVSLDGTKPKRDRNNLPYFTRRGYNYDRVRSKSEGNDWGDETES